MDAPDLSQQSSRSSQDGWLAVDPPCDCDLTATVTCDRDHPPHLKSAIRRWRQGVEEPHNRGAIEPRSHIFRRGITPTWSDDDRRRPRTMIDPQSWPDRGPIVARSWPNRGAFEVKLGLNPPLNLVQIIAELKPRRRQVEVPPMTPQIRAHDRIKRPEFSG